MIRVTARSAVVLAIAGIMMAAPMARATAQEPNPYWMVITLKMQFVEGKPLMMLMGPLPSATLCDAGLKAAIEAQQQTGLEVKSSACRDDVTVTVPAGNLRGPLTCDTARRTPTC